MRRRKVLKLEVSEEQLELLSVLDERGDPQRALDELLARVRDGVTRPGAWERAWLEKAFWHGWQAKLEPDPDAPWRQRVSRRTRR